jgi:hypothetical protein
MASLSEAPGQPKPDRVAARPRYVFGMISLALVAALSFLVFLDVL